MRGWSRLRRLPSWSAVAAVVVLLVFAYFILAFVGVGEGSESGAQGGPEMSRDDFQALAIGSSRDEVQRAVGKGDDALEFESFGGAGTGTAVEPMDAACVYYGYPGTEAQDVVQLCYRDDELSSKRLFVTPLAT